MRMLALAAEHGCHMPGGRAMLEEQTNLAIEFLRI